MADNIPKVKGQLKSTKDDRGGAVLYSHPIIGIVKNNIDPTHSGKIQVFLRQTGSPNENDARKWTTVSYMSPFFGYTDNTSSSSDYGKYVGNPQSYGFWATPPDIGTEVICIFVDGKPNQGYYVGSLPRAGLNHMVPAIGSSDSIVANEGEAKSYGGSTRLPVSEINNANTKQDQSTTLTQQPKVVHSYQAAILNKQGLIRDSDRGTISSSAQRESPSRVFGMSTPGRPIYQGGYDDSTLGAAIANKESNTNFKVVGRTGGHTLVMDDGDVVGKDQLMRFRTTGGHMVMMNDTAQLLMIMHSSGQSYIEFGKEGTIDMYSTNSVNVRTQGDLNLHADNNININATKDLNINAENIHLQSSKQTTMFSGTDYNQQVKGNYTNKVGGGMSSSAAGDTSIKAGGTAYINGGPDVKLNTGSSSLVPNDVSQLVVKPHVDTLFDSERGYIPAPAKLQSIVSRAPAHAPWASANLGVDVKSNLTAAANLPAAPSPSVSAVNSAVPQTPTAPTSSSLASTVPNIPAASATLDKATTSTLVSQMATNATVAVPQSIIQQGAGVVTATDGTKTAVFGPLAINPSQMAQSGVLKPGADVAINNMIQSGVPIDKAMAPAFFTGKDGITNVSQFVNNVNAQTGTAVVLLAKSESDLKTAGVIGNNESPTNTAGLVLSGATVGTGPTADAAKAILNNQTNINSIPGGASVTSVAAAATVVAGLTSLGSSGSVTSAGDLLGKAKDLISSGNFAANLSDKSLSGLTAGAAPNLSLTDQIKGAAAGAFEKIKATFKPLSAGVPQNLTEIKAKASEEQAAADAGSGSSQAPGNNSSGILKGLGSIGAGLIGSVISKVGLSPDIAAGLANKATTGLTTTINNLSSADNIGTNSINAANSAVNSAVQSATANTSDPGSTIQTAGAAVNNIVNNATSSVPGIDALPGGASAVSNIVDSSKSNIAGKLPNIPGIGSITSAISGISLAGGIPSLSSLNDLKNQAQNAGGLVGLAGAGLSSSDAAKLSSAINSLGAGGPVPVQLPTVASNTFDATDMASQAKSLLGDSKIPSIPFGSFKLPPPLSSADVAKYDELKKQLDTQQDEQWPLRKTYLDAKLKYGDSAPETQAASQAYQAKLQQINATQQSLSDLQNKSITNAPTQSASTSSTNAANGPDIASIAKNTNISGLPSNLGGLKIPGLG